MAAATAVDAAKTTDTVIADWGDAAKGFAQAVHVDQALRREAHSLKSSSASIGLAALAVGSARLATRLRSRPGARRWGMVEGRKGEGK